MPICITQDILKEEGAQFLKEEIVDVTNFQNKTQR